MTDRKGARSRAEIPADVLAGLNAGTLETRTLAEGLAVDFAALLRAAVPEADAADAARLDPSVGVTRRMAAAGEIVLSRLGPAGFDRLAGHRSDTVRGWAAYLLAGVPGMPAAERFARIRPLADDPHFGVREWAWLALRPHVAADPAGAVALLAPWTGEASANLRRFAVEITRPRGVWCAHIGEFRQRPEAGLPLLEPVRSDPAKYVQDSAANWLNDAAKTRPDWVRALVGRWRRESRTPQTERICGRALRGRAGDER